MGKRTILLAFGGRVLGTWEWGIQSLSGIGSALGFFVAAFAVAPALTQTVKWSSAACVAALGGMSALGPILKGGALTASLPGAAMVIFAVVVAFSPPAKLAQSFNKPVTEGAA